MKTAWGLAFAARRTGPLLLVLLIAAPVLGQPVPAPPAASLDLREATIVIGPAASEGETIAADVLREEVASRTGLSGPCAARGRHADRSWPSALPAAPIALTGSPPSRPAPRSRKPTGCWRAETAHDPWSG